MKFKRKNHTIQSCGSEGEFQNLIIDIVFTQSIFNIRFLNYSQQDKHAYQSFLKKFYREYSR